MTQEERKAGALASIRRIREVGVIPFVGAGVSVNSDAPTWAELIQELANDLGWQRHGDFTPDEYFDIPELHYQRFKEAHYRDRLHEILDRNHRSNPLHRLIFDLARHNIIFTSNFDPNLELYAREHDVAITVRACKRDLSKRGMGIEVYKVHGDLANNTIVLKRSDYDSYATSEDFGELATTVRSRMVTHETLFIGYRMADPDMQALFQSALNALDRKALPGYLLEVVGSYDEKHYEFMRERGINVLYYEDIEDEIVGFVRDYPDSSSASLGPIGRKLFDFLRYILEGDKQDLSVKQQREAAQAILTSTYDALWPLRMVRALTPDQLLAALTPYTYRVGEIRGSLYITREDLVIPLKRLRTWYVEKRALSRKERKQIRFIMQMFARGGINELVIGSGRDRVSIRLIKPSQRRAVDAQTLLHDFRLKEVENNARNLSALDVNDGNVPTLLETAHLFMEIGEPIESYNLLHRLRTYAQQTKNDWLEFVAFENMQTVSRLLWSNMIYYGAVKDALRIRDEVLAIGLESLWDRNPSFQFRSLAVLIDEGHLYHELHKEMQSVLKEMEEALENTKRGYPGFHDPPLISRTSYISFKADWFIEGNDLFGDFSAMVRDLRRDYCRAHYLQYLTDAIDVSRAAFGDFIQDTRHTHEIPYGIIYGTVTNFEPKELEAMFDQLRITSFKVSEPTRSRFVSAAVNLLAFATDIEWRQRLFFLNVYLPNFFSLLSRIELEPRDVSRIFEAVCRYTKKRRIQKDWLPSIRLFVRKHVERKAVSDIVTTENILARVVRDAVTVRSELLDRRDLGRLLHSLVDAQQQTRRSYKAKTNSEVVGTLTDVLRGWTKSESSRTNDLVLNVLLPLVPVLPARVRTSIATFIQQRLRLEWWPNSADIFYRSVIDGVINADEVTFGRYMNSALEAFHAAQSPESDIDDDRRFEAFSVQLAWLLDGNHVSASWLASDVEAFRQSSPFLRFACDPLAFDVTEIQIRWLLDIPLSVLQTIAGHGAARDEILKLLIQAIETEPATASTYSRILHTLLTPVQ